jgi:hypothetical protein
MKNRKLWIAVLAMALLSGCATPVHIYTDLDRTVPFDQYSTYNFLEFTEGNLKTIPGMELERIRVTVARELENHGLTFSEKDADVSVQVTVYHREAVDGYYYGPYGYHYLERALAVDMYDNKSRKHVWHCAAVSELVSDPDKRAEQLPGLVAEIFRKYPVQPTATGGDS